jgi:hypothetical protein
MAGPPAVSPRTSCPSMSSLPSESGSEDQASVLRLPAWSFAASVGRYFPGRPDSHLRDTRDLPPATCSMETLHAHGTIATGILRGVSSRLRGAGLLSSGTLGDRGRDRDRDQGWRFAQPVVDPGPFHLSPRPTSAAGKPPPRGPAGLWSSSSSGNPRPQPRRGRLPPRGSRKCGRRSARKLGPRWNDCRTFGGIGMPPGGSGMGFAR